MLLASFIERPLVFPSSIHGYAASLIRLPLQLCRILQVVINRILERLFQLVRSATLEGDDVLDINDLTMDEIGLKVNRELPVKSFIAQHCVTPAYGPDHRS